MTYWQAFGIFLIDGLKIFIAMLIFVKAFKKREKFVLRNIISIGVTLAVIAGVSGLTYVTEQAELIGYITITICSVVWLIVCFKGKPLDYVFHWFSGSFVSAGLSCVRQAFLVCRFLSDDAAKYIVPDGILDALFTIVCMALIYVICWYGFGKRLDNYSEANTKIYFVGIFILNSIIIYVCSYVSEYIKLSNVPLCIIFSLSVALYCGIVIYMQYVIFLKQQYAIQRNKEIAERETIEALSAETYKQYMQLRESMDVINIKCHDIKHFITSMGSGSEKTAEEIKKAVEIYDCTVKTGNESLDIILTSKSLTCQAKSIRLACVADGAKLGFMQMPDIYSLFGNALDNAIEYLEKIDEQKRFIRLQVKAVNELLVIRVENYFESELNLTADGVPETSKGDVINHGYGIKSMRHIAEKYGGQLNIEAEDHLFVINICIPLN